jgi:uncharacterized protein YidB (DUF937 family)
MGLMDVLSGMKHGPQGQPAPGTGQPAPGTSGAGGAMSPMTMAILGLLAYKAMKSFGGGQPGAPSRAGQPQSQPLGDETNVGTSSGSGGGHGDLLQGGLGGLLAGGGAGSILGGGLNDLMKQFQQRGLGDTANSWIGAGPNKAVAPNDLAKALGADQINSLMEQSGLSRDELLQGLSRHLPQIVDQLTPEGRVPHKIPM